MDNKQYDIGMIGLGTMGRNLILNMGDKGFSAVGYDKDFNKISLLEKEAGSLNIHAARSLDEFLGLLKKPRLIMMLVPAGAAVDAIIQEVLPFLEKGDVIIDGGNSHFTDTGRRIKDLEAKGYNFIGVGISGGEKGARFGPSIMPGGDKEAYRHLQPIFEAIAARAGDEPCVSYLGPGAAGHYVKMVHNGIEYGLIQLISETYHLLKTGLDFTNDELGDLFKAWNAKELHSFLIEISAIIFHKEDDKKKGRLIDSILDQARQKGTGKWTSQDAMDLQIPLPTIDMAVVMRDMSAQKQERVAAAKILKGPSKNFSADKKKLTRQLEQALYFGMVTTYAQGMALLKKASESYGYGLKLKEVAKIWRGGCIIRAALLEDILSAYSEKPDLQNLIAETAFAGKLNEKQADLRTVIQTAVEMGIPVPGMMASLAYFDSYRSAWLPANLVQAQRDFFGAHTYERIDKEGSFHTQWEQKQE
ncbi:MAG: NADP-dependent phosphogluconate dehydrogenase [Ignavibacteriales bacterium]